jgi:hypothetical protein
VSDRILAPSGLADLHKFVLPSRACLLSVRDTLCVVRRLALDDSVRQARRACRQGRPDRDLRSTAALQALWEAVSCMELAANVAAPWVDPQLQSPNGAWVEMTHYDPGRANRFYESSHKWSDERYAVLSAHRFRHGDDTTLLAVLHEEGMVDERIDTAVAEAQDATARLLREHFLTLAASWASMRAYAAAFEHGLLFVPAEAGDVVDADGNVIPHAIIIWERRKEESRGHIGDSVEAAVDAAQQAGELAIDVAFHVADARLRVLESLEFDGDQVYLRPLDHLIPFWVRRGDLSDETLQLLQHFRITWVEEN